MFTFFSVSGVSEVNVLREVKDLVVFLVVGVNGLIGPSVLELVVAVSRGERGSVTIHSPPTEVHFVQGQNMNMLCATQR